MSTEPLLGRCVVLRSATGEIARVVIGEVGDRVVIASAESVARWLRERVERVHPPEPPPFVAFPRADILRVLDAPRYEVPDVGPPIASAGRARRARRVVSRERRGTAPDRMFALVCAAVRLADAIDTPESLDESKPDWHQLRIAASEELDEAALAYARGLSPADRARLGRSARRRGDGT